MKLFDEVCSALNEMKLNYKGMPDQEGRDILAIGVSADNYTGLNVYIFFDEKSVQIKCFEICKFPEDKNLIMLQTVNKLNCDYRWVTFTAIPDGKVSASIDIDTKETTTANDVISTLSRINSIMDIAYPVIMKALYV